MSSQKIPREKERLLYGGSRTKIHLWRTDDRRMERIKFSLGLSNMVMVKGDGKGGGIAVLWRRGVNAILRNYSINHIDIDVVEDVGFSWRFTGVYGNPRQIRITIHGN